MSEVIAATIPGARLEIIPAHRIFPASSSRKPSTGWSPLS
jgi:hypothetical protein